ncbi:recombinase family protein [Limobrevibacterium gyesilva]|uniref:Recombinase family protein n=1 Tax=Limobrevibacterium gyesilva TaxID=2991712 RepID=A0AA41YNN9_9PROT|nr:recombinase family protein [Limobrevibacterium gyesilva]MCW3475717.1 recombinase family protein [Limobrevibacterium gyesilva]
MTALGPTPTLSSRLAMARAGRKQPVRFQPREAAKRTPHRAGASAAADPSKTPGEAASDPDSRHSDRNENQDIRIKPRVLNLLGFSDAKFRYQIRCMIYGYARVPATAQDLAPRVAELKAAGCKKILREKITGTTADRLQLRKLIAMLAPGDAVIISVVDRLSRDTIDLLVIAREMRRKDKPKLTEHRKREAQARVAAGETQRSIVRSHNASQATMSRLAP